MALVRVIPRRFSVVDAAVLVLVGLAVYGVVRLAAEWREPATATVEIDLGLAALPLYTFYSLCRGLAAFALSLAFTLVYGYVAARVRRADALMLPVLDVLQSIPVLGFMPGVVLALAALFPASRVGLELAAIVMIFTGQVWNMTFAFYHSLRAIPSELLDAARVYRFGWWRRFRRVELPAATVPLVWNGMMSMAGGWFFLTVNEAFRLGARDFRLPGVGAYMSVAIDRGDRLAMLAAVIAMIVMIVVIDQLLWRPLVAWSQRFKLEDVGAQVVARSWVLDLLRSTRLYLWLRAGVASLRARRPARPPARGTPRPALSRGVRLAATGIVLALVAAGALLGGARLVRLLAPLDVRAWLGIGRAAGLTLVRTTAAVALGSLWTVPAGVYIGTHPRAARVLQPVVQVAASFPAPMLFPLVLFLLARLGVPLGAGSVALMMLGTQWYILFNVIAGASSIPQELHEVAAVFRLPWRRRWLRLLLPGVLPSLVTGWVTAAGGAWNASIVAEYVHAAGAVRTTDGLGALISAAADAGDLPRLGAGVLAMAVIVVAVNRIVWKRLYDLAERRFAPVR